MWMCLLKVKCREWEGVRLMTDPVIFSILAPAPAPISYILSTPSLLPFCFSFVLASVFFFETKLYKF